MGLSKELREVDKALKFNPSSVTLLSEKQDILADSVKAAREELKALEAAQGDVERMYAAGEIDRGAYLEFQRKIEAARANLERLQNQQVEFGGVVGQIMQQAGEKVTQFGGKIEDVGNKLMPLSTATAAAGAATVKMAWDFEDSMAKVSTIADATIEGYKRLLIRANQAIGHMAIQDIRATHLNSFYKNLSENGIRATAPRAIPKGDLRAALQEKKLSMVKVAKLAGVAESTVNAAGKREPILKEKAELIAKATGIPFDKLFDVDERNEPLSTTSILAYHRFIHIVLAQAEKEMLVPYNAADKATPPQKEKSEVGTFQTSELIAIRDAAAQEPIKWQMIIHLLMITGCRRGEIVGLKWDRVNWKDSSIRIDSTLLYTPERGVYESTTKTGAERTIKLPKETMDLLRQYRVWQLETRLACGDRWKDTPYVFTGECGGCMAPDTLSGYLSRFEKKYNLPHIHAHKFRHSMASVLYFSGADPVSISKRLGHAQVSTTQNIYSHLIEQADTQSAERIADAIFRTDKRTG